jgi:5-methylcytosine-specific restriction endonuclease McrA
MITSRMKKGVSRPRGFPRSSGWISPRVWPQPSRRFKDSMTALLRKRQGIAYQKRPSRDFRISTSSSSATGSRNPSLGRSSSSDTDTSVSSWCGPRPHGCSRSAATTSPISSAANEHIIPESDGGATEEENLWLACSLCNSYKGSRTSFRDPISGREAPLFNPRRENWAEHFTWEESGSKIVGLTATGRATVIVLVLNRPPLVNARKRWVAVGWHPP